MQVDWHEGRRILCFCVINSEAPEAKGCVVQQGAYENSAVWP